MTGATTQIAEFAAETDHDDVPADLPSLAKRMVLDTVGVAVRGADSDAARIAREATPGLVADPSSADAHLPGTDVGGDPGAVAFATGVSAHVHDFDDVHRGMGGHPSAPVLSAVLPVAEATNATGRDLLGAFVVGTEVEVALGAALNPGHYERGWHPTAVLGHVGAAVGAGALLDLDAPALARAVGIAASQAGGVKANFGTMTKSYHVGNAARAGAEAARLAAAGFTASESAIEADFGGFLDLFEGDPPHAVDALESLGSWWRLTDPGVWFKAYPCCGSTHAAVDAARSIREDGGLAPDEVARVAVTEHPRRLDHTDRPVPTTALDAKFSVQYCVAVGLADGDVWLDDFEGAALERPAIARLTDLVEVRRDPDCVTDEWGARLTVEADDGSIHEATVAHPRGAAENPLSDAKLDEKYRRCAGHALPEAAVEESLETVRRLEEVPDVGTLCSTLSTA